MADLKDSEKEVRLNIINYHLKFSLLGNNYLIDS